MENSYVYQHICIKSSKVFYIGIGTGKNYERAYSKNNRNRIWNNYISSHGDYRVEIIKDKISRVNACEIETKMITNIGRIVDKTGPLTNISFGGEKTFYGMIRTEEHCRKISEGQKGKKYSDETIKKMSDAKKGIILTDEHKIKIGIGNKGKVLSKETRQKQSIAKKGVKRPPQTKQHIELRRLSGCFGSNKKKIMCLNNNIEYNSATEASIYLGIKSTHISSVCTGKRKHTFGYKFKHI